MRTIGPGSVASLLKIALDIAYAVLWAGLIMVSLAFIALLLSLPFVAGAAHGTVMIDGQPQDLSGIVRRWPALAAFLLSVDAYVLVLGYIINRLRRVFETLVVGDPFRPANVRRLRTVAIALIALEVGGYFARLSLAWMLPELSERVTYGISLSSWFAILAVFVLAEVFREGARLRGDAELTI
jgi:hypothetical protein